MIEPSRQGDGSGAPEERTWRVGVDVGGTFTDMVVADSSGALRVYKAPTVPDDPAEGVMRVIALAAAAEDLDARAFLARTTLFSHGSTIATNTVLERKGATVGLLTTEGFRDSLEIRRGRRYDPWDHRKPFPDPLVPREWRLPVRGRLDRDGGETAALVEADVLAAVDAFREDGVQSVAICLFNSFLNDTHEAQVAAMLARAMPDVPVSVSSAIAPIIGEYERVSTTALNAYVAPRTVGYLQRLDARLQELGLAVPLLMIQNNGGSVPVSDVAARPVTLLLSGPAAGVGALGFYAQSAGSDDLVSMEIGGTSCDVILMQGGSVAFTDDLDIGGYDCVSPSVEVHTVGAGGGAIARVDEGGLLHVGPEGAGARPGPACYGLGGVHPTITDAQVVLGRLRPGAYAGGSVTVDAGLAEASIEWHIARPLRLSVEAAAIGMIRLMEQTLLLAVQRLSSERGHDPRRFTLVAGGGAGPLHGASVGRMLGCRRVYLPRLAGAFCALGMLHADVRHDVIRVHLALLGEKRDERLAAAFRDMAEGARLRLVREGFDEHAIRIGRALDLRYVGQQWDITIAVDPEHRPARIRADFEREHDRLFGHMQPGGEIEITKARVTGMGRLPPLEHERPKPASAEAEPFERRLVWIDPGAGWIETPAYRGMDLAPGHVIEGPAIVAEQTATVLIGRGDRLAVDPSGNFSVELRGARL